MYRIGGKLVEPDDPELDSILENAYQHKVRPLCMCKGEPGIPMYLSHLSENGRYLIKRMPSSGEQHEKDCGSWEVSDGISGRGDILHNGYDLEKGHIALRFDFPLTKYGKRDDEDISKHDAEEDAAEDEEGAEPDVVSLKEPDKRLTLRAFLDALWEDAGLNSRQGGDPRPDWAAVYARLMQAVDGKTIRRRPLGDSLYVPPPVEADEGEEHGPSLRRRLMDIAARSIGGKRVCLIVVAEMVGKPTPAPSGNFRIHLGPDSGFSFGMSEEMCAAFLKSYGKDRAVMDDIDGSHQIVAAIVSATPKARRISRKSARCLLTPTGSHSRRSTTNSFLVVSKRRAGVTSGLCAITASGELQCPRLCSRTPVRIPF